MKGLNLHYPYQKQENKATCMIMYSQSPGNQQNKYTITSTNRRLDPKLRNEKRRKLLWSNCWLRQNSPVTLFNILSDLGERFWLNVEYMGSHNLPKLILVILLLRTMLISIVIHYVRKCEKCILMLCSRVLFYSWFLDFAWDSWTYFIYSRRLWSK